MSATAPNGKPTGPVAGLSTATDGRFPAPPRALRVRLQWGHGLPEVPDTLLITISLSSVLLFILALQALVLGYGWLGLLMGVPAVVVFGATCSMGRVVRDPPDETDKGDVQNLSHEEFERLVERVDLLGGRAPVPHADVSEHFGQLVRDALDELPHDIQNIIADNVAVLISDDGAQRGCYGFYSGGTVVHATDYGHTIEIFRDTLVRDFGHDPDELRRQVAITVRHEVAHHIGASERHVAELGL